MYGIGGWRRGSLGLLRLSCDSEKGNKYWYFFTLCIQFQTNTFAALPS